MAIDLKGKPHSRSDNPFFDVLIDQIVSDVRQEFEELSNSKKTNSATAPSDDLVARLIDFRSRRESFAKSSSKNGASGFRRESLAPSAKLQTIASLMGQSAIQTPETLAASPGFKDAEAEVAFQVVARFGARFYSHDFHLGGILPNALKRERRRVLLNLHPDRHPEADQAKAHERFLSASEAFTTLADRAMSDMDSNVGPQRNAV